MADKAAAKEIAYLARNLDKFLEHFAAFETAFAGFKDFKTDFENIDIQDGLTAYAILRDIARLAPYLNEISQEGYLVSLNIQCEDTPGLCVKIQKCQAMVNSMSERFDTSKIQDEPLNFKDLVDSFSRVRDFLIAYNLEQKKQFRPE